MTDEEVHGLINNELNATLLKKTEILDKEMNLFASGLLTSHTVYLIQNITIRNQELIY